MPGELRENAITRLVTITGIDATATGATTLFTVPTGKTMIPIHVVIRVTAFTSGGKGVQAVASFGGNSATYDDFLNTQTYTVAAADTFQRDAPATAELVTQAAGDVFKISIETASNATVEVWAVDLYGYLV